MKKYDVYFWGILCQDIVLRLAGIPSHDTDTRLLEERLAIGGDAANSAHAASHLGLKVVLQPNHLGRDETGSRLLRELRKRGHALVGIKRNDFPTVHAYVLALPNGERSIHGAFAHKAISPPDVKLIKRARVFCLDGYYAPDALSGLGPARQAGVPIFANDICPSEKYFSRVDFNILSSLSGDEKTARRFLEKAKQRSEGTVIVTAGSAGSVAMDNAGQFYRQKGFKTRVVDSTGAGDCFRAAFIYAYLEGWEMQRSLRFAGAFAALSCRGMGATGYLPSLAEVKRLIRG